MWQSNSDNSPAWTAVLLPNVGGILEINEIHHTTFTPTVSEKFKKVTEQNFLSEQSATVRHTEQVTHSDSPIIRRTLEGRQWEKEAVIDGLFEVIFQVKLFYILTPCLLFCVEEMREISFYKNRFWWQLLKQLRGGHQDLLEYILSSAVSTSTHFDLKNWSMPQ